MSVAGRSSRARTAPIAHADPPGRAAPTVPNWLCLGAARLGRQRGLDQRREVVEGVPASGRRGPVRIRTAQARHVRCARSCRDTRLDLLATHAFAHEMTAGGPILTCAPILVEGRAAERGLPVADRKSPRSSSPGRARVAGSRVRHPSGVRGARRAVSGRSIAACGTRRLAGARTRPSGKLRPRRGSRTSATPRTPERTAASGARSTERTMMHHRGRIWNRRTCTPPSRGEKCVDVRRVSPQRGRTVDLAPPDHERFRSRFAAARGRAHLSAGPGSRGREPESIEPREGILERLTQQLHETAMAIDDLAAHAGDRGVDGVRWPVLYLYRLASTIRRGLRYPST